MRDIRRSRHCRRIFFRYLRQRDKEKEAEKELYQQNQTKPTTKLNPQFDKFNTTISTIIVVTIFFGIISIFIHYYAVITLFSALILEILIAVIGAIHYGNKERKDETETTQSSILRQKNISDSVSTTNDNQTSYNSPQKELLTTQTFNETEPSIVIEPFDMLTGVQFKDLIEKHFKKNGYSVNRISPRINGIDFLIEKDNKTVAIATKKTFDLIQRSYINNVIESAKMYENISKTMIITTSLFFMPQAKKLAEEYGIILCDRETLKSNLGGLK